MSIWATLFLEGWKRYHAEIAWKWGLMDIVVDEVCSLLLLGFYVPAGGFICKD